MHEPVESLLLRNAYMLARLHISVVSNDPAKTRLNSMELRTPLLRFDRYREIRVALLATEKRGEGFPACRDCLRNKNGRFLDRQNSPCVSRNADQANQHKNRGSA